MVIRAASFSLWEAQSNIDSRTTADDDDHGEGRATATLGSVPERIVRGRPLSWILVDDVPQ
jgi:hypothetical protein